MEQKESVALIGVRNEDFDLLGLNKFRFWEVLKLQIHIAHL